VLEIGGAGETEQRRIHNVALGRRALSSRNRNLHMNLRRAALRTEWPSILNHCPTLFARMIHRCETNAEAN
jgi:hypothetical protein